jgi:hypothetical protein
MSCHGLGPASQPKPKYEGMEGYVTKAVRGLAVPRATYGAFLPRDSEENRGDLSSPFNSSNPFNPYSQFVEAGPSGGCRSGQGPRDSRR